MTISCKCERPSDRPCSTSLVINICLQLNYLLILVLPSPVTSAGVGMSTICQSYKSSEFRLAQYLPQYIWSQSPSLHLIDQTTPRIRISSMGSFYCSRFTSAWQSAVSGSTVCQKRLQADYISIRTFHSPVFSLLVSSGNLRSQERKFLV